MSTLFLVATPIGNMEDISLRALRILGSAGALACEDTRVTRRLFERHEMPWPGMVLSYHEHNEEKAGARIIEILDQGNDLVLCTDAGYPGVSDPGWRLIDAVLETDHEIIVLPGAGAVEVALLYSGLPTSSFTFRGFPPRKGGKRRTFLSLDADRPHTMIFYESPHRVGKMLADAHEVLGNRRAAVCLELTKKFERIHRGPLADLAAEFKDKKVKGEVVVVIAGNNEKFLCG